MDVPSYLLGKQAGGGGGQPSLQNKSVTITENGTQNVTADAGYDGLKNVGITTNVQPSLQNKNITINENTTTNISSDSGYDGLGTVSVTTNIQPNLETKSITITENTTTTITPTAGKDGLSSVEVITNVSGGEQNVVLGDPIGFGVKFYEGITEIKNIDFSGITNMSQLFSGLSHLKTVPTIDTTGVSNMPSMFQSCSSLKTIPLLNTSSVGNMSSMFAYCYNLEDIPIFDTSNVTNFYNMFNSCGKLTDTSLNNILEMCINATSYTDTKTLARLGLTSSKYSVAKIQSLPSYQDFLDAGWTIGY